jgi:hypothetical protein
MMTLFMNRLATLVFAALLLAVPALAQRTPLQVNGTVVSNPNLKDGSEVTYDVSGGDITASVANTITFDVLTVTTTFNPPASFSSGDIYVTNLYVTNLTVQTVTNVNVLYATNLYVTQNTITSNLYVTNINVKNLTVESNIYVAFSGFVTNDLTVYANTYGSNIYAGNLIVSNNITGTIDPTQSGLTVKQRRSFKLQFPTRGVDGAGCTYPNTNDFTAAASPPMMTPRFSGSAATNGNYCRWAFRVPDDIDTSVDVTASLSVVKQGTSTSAMTFTVGQITTANGTAVPGTPANYNTITVTPASGTTGAIESSNANTLTGWAANMIANRWCLVQLQRDGSGDSNNDSADLYELEIFYTSTQ